MRRAHVDRGRSQTTVSYCLCPSDSASDSIAQYGTEQMLVVIVVWYRCW